MKLINTKSEEAKWFTYPEDETLQFKIRPMSIYSLNKVPGEDMQVELSDIPAIFIYSLVDWKGVGEKEDKPAKCTTEAKLSFLNTYQEICNFIIEMASNMRADLGNEAPASKNLLKSQPGEMQGSEKPLATSV